MGWWGHRCCILGWARLTASCGNDEGISGGSLPAASCGRLGVGTAAAAHCRQRAAGGEVCRNTTAPCRQRAAVGEVCQTTAAHCRQRAA
eukprot:4663319-Pyramimonas_sp.AAC.1